MKYDEETSSHPLLPTGSSSSPDSPADFDTYPSNPPSKRSSSSRYLSQLKRPRLKGWLALLAVSLAGFALSLVFRGGSSTGTSQVEGWSWKTRPKASEGLVKAGGRRGRNDSYLDNLLPNINYVTAFQIGGLNNEVISQFNLLHLTFLLRKNAASPFPYTPIVSPFLPHFSHLTGGEGANAAPVLRFSQVFDIDRLAESVGWGILEWSDLKDGFAGDGMGGRIEDEWKTEEEREEERKAVLAGEKTVEKMGQGMGAKDVMACWSTWMSSRGGGRLVPSMGEYYGFKTVDTPLPPSLFAATDRAPHHLLFPSLANFLTPPDNRLRSEYLSFQNDEADRGIKSWGKNMTKEDVFDKKKGWIEPSTKPGEVTCFDVLYYGSDKGEEVRDVYRAKPPLRRDTGPWATIGQYAHWNPDLRAIGVNTLRQVLGMADGKAIPNVFTMHIRRTDFMPSCPSWAQPCYAVSHFADHLNYIRDLYVNNGTRGAKDWPVVVTTDETDKEYLAEIASHGWHLVDHHALRTRERFGVWYPSMIDNVVLSLGRGFVGTESSTMTLLAGRRVEDWNGGHSTRVSSTETRWPFNPENPDA